jgi:hypothetical protein
MAASTPCRRQPRGARRLYKGNHRLSREDAAGSPHATVEVWATDEHRIGLKPLLKRVWTLPGQRPVEPRYDWRYLVVFVHPASGRIVWRLATGVSAELFSAELAASAAAVGASLRKQIVLVLDGAGRHTSPQVRVPEYVHLLFLPAHSPELQPCEHLWQFSDAPLVHRHFRDIEELGRSRKRYRWRAAPCCSSSLSTCTPQRCSPGGLAG